MLRGGRAGSIRRRGPCPIVVSAIGRPLCATRLPVSIVRRFVGIASELTATPFTRVRVGGSIMSRIAAARSTVLWVSVPEISVL